MKDKLFIGLGVLFLIACIICFAVDLKRSKEVDNFEIFAICIFSVMVIAGVILLAMPADSLTSLLEPKIGVRFFPYLELYTIE